MGIKEMHELFRQLGQQMGMQRDRAILPDQIDMVINTAISDTVNQIIKDHIGVTNQVTPYGSKLGSINALRSLYKTQRVVFDDLFTIVDNDDLYPSWEATEENISNELNLIGSNGSPLYLHLVSFGMNFSKGGVSTNYYPIRVIDNQYITETLNDAILKPKFTSPVITIFGASDYNNNDNKDSVKLIIYIDKGTKDSTGIKLNCGLIPNKFSITYIGNPNKVHFSEVESECINCDLPEYLHTDIVKHAIDLYHISVSKEIYASQKANNIQQNNSK